jgi:hypothetical protein
MSTDNTPKTPNTNTFTINVVIDNNDKTIESPNKKQKLCDVYEENKEENNKNENTYNQEDLYSMKNLCVECGIDMGYCNPRQYCGKTYCHYSIVN